MAVDSLLNIVVRLRNQASSGFAELNADITRLQQSAMRMQSIGRNLTFGLTLPIVMMGRSLLQTGSEYSTHMNAIRGAMQATAQDMALINRTIMEQSSRWYQRPTELAAGMERLAHAYGETFRNSGEMMSFFRVLVPFATASQWGLEESSRALIGIMNQWQVPMTRARDVTEVLSNTALATTSEVRELASALRYVGPVAAQSGMSLNSAAAALGIMAQNNINATMAGTSLRNVILNTLLPTGRYAQLLRSMGGAFRYDANGQIDFGEILGRMQRGLRSGRITPEQIVGMVGKRGGPAFLAMIQNTRDATFAFNQFVKQTRTAGTTERYAEEMTRGLSGALNRLASTWERFKISLTEGALGRGIAILLNYFSDFLELISNMPDWLQTTIGFVLTFLAVLGPAIYIFGALKVAVLMFGRALLSIARFAVIHPGLIITLIVLGYLLKKVIQGYREWQEVASRSDKTRRNTDEMGMWANALFRMTLVFDAIKTYARDFPAYLETIGKSLEAFGNVLNAVFSSPTSAGYRQRVTAAWDQFGEATRTAQLHYTRLFNTTLSQLDAAYNQQHLGVNRNNQAQVDIQITPPEGMDALILGQANQNRALVGGDGRGPRVGINIQPARGVQGVGIAPYLTPSLLFVRDYFLGM